MGTGIDLKSRVALIVGGSGSLGQAISLRLASLGANVAIAYFSNKEAAQTTAKKILKMGSQAVTIQADITVLDDVEKMVSEVVRNFGTVDILVNSSGVALTSLPVTELETTTWERTINVNLTGTFLCCKTVAPIMIERKSGSIINISSIFGRNSPALRSSYGSSKHGLIGLTQTLAKELGPHNITVNAVCPGPVETSMVREIWAKTAKQLGITFEKYYKDKVSDIPLGRLAMPEEVADLVAFLGSDMSKYIRGTIIDIAGAAT